MKELSSDQELLASIRRDWPGDKPDTNLSIHIGPFASGAAVLADQSTLNLIINQQRKLLGIDMETYGIFTAAAEAPEPRPRAFSVKSVVDFADGQKDDRYQRYAAFTSAMILRHFAERFL